MATLGVPARRGIAEPALEKVLRGPHDGFTETLVYNTALIRRRLRDPQFRAEVVHVGRRSRTDVALVYLKDVADPGLVEAVRQRLQRVRFGAGAVVVIAVPSSRRWHGFGVLPALA